MLRLCSAILLAVVALISCNTTDCESVMVDINPEGWYAPAELAIHVYDARQTVDMQIAMRYQDQMAGDSVELLLTVMTPDSVRWREAVTLHLPKTNSVISNYDAPYRSSIKWPLEGSYQVTIAPARIYKGVLATGITTKPHTNN